MMHLGWMRSTAIVPLGLGLLALALPRYPAQASFDDCSRELLNSGVSGETAAVACAEALEPEVLAECVLEIQSRTFISADEALEACYRDRRPIELAECVVDIRQDVLEPYVVRISTINAPPTTEVPDSEEDIVPENGSDTVEDEDGTDTAEDTVEEAAPSVGVATETLNELIQPITLLALNTCRRSILPERHSDCVVGLSQGIPDLAPADAMEACISAETYPPETFIEVAPIE
ncbi:MAG: hypothetical protein ACFB4I_04425 [Cyanophyceae cyanobacterium]